MRFTIIATIVTLFLQSSMSQYTFEYSESVCQRPWFERLFWNRASTEPVITEMLREHILMGKPALAVLTMGDYVEAFTLHNLNMNGDVICGESVDRMSSPITSFAEFEPIIVCTNGYVNYLNISVSEWSGNVRRHGWAIDTISFRTRDYNPENRPVSSRYLDGSSNSQFTDNVFAMAHKSEMRGVMRDRGYAFAMENTHMDTESFHLSGQSLSHISVTYTSTGEISFRDQPYYWLSSWETTGRRDSARFTLGDMNPLKHTNDFVALQWYADACWTVAYTHNEKGTRIAGSLEMLRSYIRMGHRVRVNFDGFTLEPSMLLITPEGVVVAQTSTEMARRGGSGSDKTFFNTKTRQIYRLVHSSGYVMSYYYFIENGGLSEKSTIQTNVTWSVDTRPWNPIVSMDSANNYTMGSSLNLPYYMQSASLRVRVEIKEDENRYQGKNTEMYLEINNVRSPKINAAEPEIIGQSLRTIPFQRRGRLPMYEMYLYRPFKQFIEVSSRTGLAVHTFNMASHQYGRQAYWPVESITWFQDNRI